MIDEDLGRSGTGSVERPGFGRLLKHFPYFCSHAKYRELGSARQVMLWYREEFMRNQEQNKSSSSVHV